MATTTAAAPLTDEKFDAKRQCTDCEVVLEEMRLNWQPAEGREGSLAATFAAARREVASWPAWLSEAELRAARAGEEG